MSASGETKFESAERERERRRAEWRATLHKRRLLTVAETLFWVALRDLEATAKYFDGWEELHRKELKIESLIENRSRSGYWSGVEGAVQPKPYSELCRAARLGEVIAFAYAPSATNRSPIPADAWLFIELVEQDDKGAIEASVPGGGIWSGVLFDRASVLRAFPALDSTEEQLKAVEREAWAPCEGESGKKWLRRADVEPAARQALRAEGVSNPSEAKICEKLAEMARPYLSYKANSIKTDRRDIRREARIKP